jgi:hypothetical protein
MYTPITGCKLHAKIKINATQLHLRQFSYLCILVKSTLGNSTSYSTGADKLGIASAVACTIHCLLIPALFVVKYSFTANINTHFAEGLPSWWPALDYLFLVVSFVAVYHAATHAAERGIKRFLWLFWICLAIAIVFEQQLHWLAYIASAGLVTTHVRNIIKHRKKATAIS